LYHIAAEAPLLLRCTWCVLQTCHDVQQQEHEQTAAALLLAVHSAVSETVADDLVTCAMFSHCLFVTV
jgi:hypothetical protein